MFSSNLGGMNGADLDRHITGNYGEDQFEGCHDCPRCGQWCREDGTDDHECLCGECDGKLDEDWRCGFCPQETDRGFSE